MDATKGYVVQQISEYGTSNENVARITLQTHELTRITNLGSDAKEQLFLAANEISHRLASAQSAALELQKLVEEQTRQIEAGEHLREGRGVELPFIPSLQILFEGYYYNLKNVIRDLGGTPMKILYGKRFEEASCWFSFKDGKEADVSKHLRRLEASNHAGYSTVRELIDRNRDNFRHIISIRNAIEHPGGSAGTVRVRNWSAEKGGIVPPYLYFEERPETRFDVVTDMIASHEAILSLAETVLVFGMMFHMPPFMGIQYRAPEARDPQAPVAYRAVFLPANAEAISKPFTGKEEG